MGIKVAKFGGSSVADVIQFKKVKSIVEADPTRSVLVVSAPGKRYETDTKLTDLLYLCQTHVEHNLPWDQLFQVVRDRFSAMALSLGLSADALDLEREFDTIRDDLNGGAGGDYIASRGEYLNALLMAHFLGFDFVDATELILFDERGHLMEQETQDAISEILPKHERAVVPGFYGSMPEGRVKTFSRGGSDITGALLAKALQADVYENWTDVHGFLVADPRIVKNPQPIETISYQELRELSYMGAGVLHEDAIFPVRETNIPINIRNTNDADHPGTMIVADASDDPDKIVTGIAGSKDFTVIALHKHMMNKDRGFVRRLFGVLSDYDLNFEHLPKGIDTMSLVLSKAKVGDRLQDIVEDIEKKLEPDHIEVNDDIALIATVGEGMSRRKGVAAALFTALADADINIRLIDQGSSEMNIIVGVLNGDFERAIRAIYGAFIGEQNGGTQ
ncbi:MAG TPA: aspartate kinase [Clostridiales bacterium]|jgi:aspartate kinase|nr:aspartate kinase [Clostridiales bacterium]